MSIQPAFEPLDVFECPLAGIRQIEASAGTGKTWNICGLYLRLLLEARLEVLDAPPGMSVAITRDSLSVPQAA